MKKITSNSIEVPYRISVGNYSAPKKVLFGTLERGNSAFKNGEAVVESDYIGGDILFPNFWYAHGRRINERGQVVEVSDPTYKGEIEFLQPNDPDGYLIECRYIQGFNSLDYQFQITKGLQIKKEEEKGNIPFKFERGIHLIDPVKDKMLALALKVHAYGDSSFKRNDYNTNFYEEVKEYEVRKTAATSIDIKFDALKIVKEASYDFGKLKVIKSVVSKYREINYDERNENTLYDSLLIFAEDNPEEFMKCIREYKESVGELIDISESNNIFDTTKKGVISFGTDIKKEVLIDKVPSQYTGKLMTQYLLDECLNENVANAIQKLKEVINKNFK